MENIQNNSESSSVNTLEKGPVDDLVNKKAEKN